MDANSVPWNGIISINFKRSQKYLWLYATLSTTTLLCARDEQTIIWTANLEKHIQVHSRTEKFIIKKIVPPSFHEPEQGWKVLTEKDWSELRKYNVTTKNGIYHKFSTFYIIDTFHTNIRFCQKISLTFIFEPWKDSKKLS